MLKKLKAQSLSLWRYFPQSEAVIVGAWVPILENPDN